MTHCNVCMVQDWILELGFSYHMCPNRDWFITYKAMNGGIVLMENSIPFKTVRIGTFQNRMHDGIVKTLTNVRHVPKLKKNLIYLGSLDSNDCRYTVEGDIIRLIKCALVVMR